MEIRPAALEDAPRIAEIHVQSWQDGYQGLMPQAYLDGLAVADRLALRTRILAEVDWSRGGSLVVADDGELAGFADFGPTRDEDQDADRVGEVGAIYLRPAAWGRGFGRQLMIAVLERLAQIGYEQVTLWVLDTNARARRFYEAAGFLADEAVKFDDSRGFRLRELRYRRQLP